jgi:glycosyltransferase involved in cell wall biosynthesis
MVIISRLKSSSCVVALTEQDARDWKPYVKEVVVIPNFITIEPKAVKNYSTPKIISAGRYAYEKGYDILLRIWSIVEKQCTDWQLDIFAMGDPTPYVKMMDDLSIDKIRCHLHSSVVEVEEEYLKSSILVQPSRTEGFGLVLVEAMACGLPVVSFDCENGPRSIITDGDNGFLVPPFDIELFANRIIQLIVSQDLRRSMGEKGRKKSQQYRIESVGEQWKLLFDELMK